MFGIYLFSAIVGVPLVAMMLVFGDADFDGDVDVDIDADVDLDVDLDADLAGGWFGDSVSGMLSIRSLVFFLAGFGAIGLVMGMVWGHAAVATAITAGIAGVAGAYTNSALTSWLKRNQVSGELSKDHLEGTAGRVSVPVEAGRKGKVTVEVEGRPVQLTAAQYRSGDVLQVGDRVVVVELDEGGTALVARLDELTEGL